LGSNQIIINKKTQIKENPKTIEKKKKKEKANLQDIKQNIRSDETHRGKKNKNKNKNENKPMKTTKEITFCSSLRTSKRL